MGFTGFPVGAVGSTPQLGGPGLALVTTATFTAVSSVSVDRCFTANYDNYFVCVNMTANSVAGEGLLRLRSAGVDSATSYKSGVVWVNYTTGGVSGAAGPTTSFACGYWDGAGNTFSITFMSPALASRTRYWGQSSNMSDDGGMFQGDHSAATSYDGLTLYPTTGTITGSLAVYGYRKG